MWYKWLKEYYHIVCFVDNNEGKVTNSIFNGIKIIKKSEIEDYECDAIVIVTEMNVEEKIGQKFMLI